jgi:predicted RNase H-like nuclease (RuvC/YqgF family)
MVPNSSHDDPIRHGITLHERYRQIMDNETRAAFTTLNETVTALSETVTAGFARADRYFELQHQQHLELLDRLDGLTDRVDALTARVDALTDRVDALTDRIGVLEREVAQLRDYFTRELSEIRFELRELRARSDQSDELRREIAELAVRVDQLEQRRSD